MNKNNIEVDIVVNDKKIRQYAHDDKIFVEARENCEYSISIRNNNWSRKLVVISVDGLNVLDGLSGGKSDNGYVINGYSTYHIKGFRTSNDEVHPFKFSSKNRSYAAKSSETKGDTSHCGVVGIRVFDEKSYNYSYMQNDNYIPREIIWLQQTHTSVDPNTSGNYNLDSFNHQIKCQNLYSLTSSSANYSSCLRSSTQPDFDMGTEFSKNSIEDKVVDINFEKSDNTPTELAIYYASFKSLEEMGVPVKQEKYISFPNPFPSKFCKPPIE